MALIYREMKARGWLEKVMLVMTMHDELVFEIDADILEQVLPIMVNLMARNQAVLGMNWPVPLTCDVEIGHDWTVPWHMTEMQFGEIRFIGDKKYKDAKKIPSGAVWEEMQRYPDELKPWISLASQESSTNPVYEVEAVAVPAKEEPVVEKEVIQVISMGTSEIALMKSEPVMPPVPNPGTSAQHSEVPREIAAVANGGIFTYQLNAPLSVGTMIKLAEVVHQCRNRGMAVLKLVTRTGEILSWNEEIRVSPTTFYVLAQHYGI